MKKIVATMMCAAMVSAYAGCVSPESVKFVKDGTYTGTAQGYDGPIEVSVVYKDNKMTEVNITKNSEPGVVAYSAMKNIPSYIVENQSVNVDVSTGATTTSKAICQAVANTVTDAGGNLKQWQADSTGKHTDKRVNYKTTAVVVGGGYSGIITALRLRQLGIQTLIVEKEPKVGGSLNYMFNTMQITAGSSAIRKENVAEAEPDQIKKDLIDYGQGDANTDLINLLVDNIGTVTDWQVSDLGMAFEDTYAKAGYTSNTARYYNTDSAELYELLTKEVKVSGAKIVPNAAVIGINYYNGQATGVTAKAVDGSVITIAADYVVLASGSYGTKQNLLNQTSSLYYGPLGASGDAITIGKSADNSFSILNQEGTAMFYTGFKLDDTYAVDAYDAIERSLKSGTFIMNESSLRFVNEDADKNTLSSAIGAQKAAYVVMNHDAYRSYKSGLLVNMSEDQRKEVLSTDSNMDDKYKCSNLKEACEKYGLDYTAASETMDSYNSDVQIKVDIRYGRAASTFSSEIDEDAECYIIPLSAYVYQTLGGIAVDSSLNVLKADGTTLSNVYAIGNVCGNVFGKAMKQGSGTAWAVVSGYIAAEEITADQEALKATPTPSASASASASAAATAEASASPTTASN